MSLIGTKQTNRAGLAHGVRACWSRSASGTYITCHGWHHMTNFFRVLRLVFRYKWTLAASSFTAIMVALLWG